MALLNRNELWLIVLFLCCIISVVVFYLIAKWRRRRILSRRFRHGVKAEDRVDKILHARGYQVCGIQKPLPLSMYVDDVKVDYVVRPDAIARKGDREYIVEVKTGKYAVDPLNIATRRQLLEYYYRSPGDGVLLVDGDAGNVHTIRFPVPGIEYRKKRSSVMRVIIAFILGALGSTVVILLWKKLFMTK